MTNIVFKQHGANKRGVPKCLHEMAHKALAELTLPEQVIVYVRYDLSPKAAAKLRQKVHEDHFTGSYTDRKHVLLGTCYMYKGGIEIELFCGWMQSWTPGRWARTLAHELGHAEHFFLYPESVKKTIDPDDPTGWTHARLEEYADMIEKRLAGSIATIHQVHHRDGRSSWSR